LRSVRYLDAFLTNAGITSAFVIAHDWGAALAFELAARRPEFIRGLAFMEFLRPLPTWEDFPANAREMFQKFRTPAVGEKMILEGNGFVEGLPGPDSHETGQGLPPPATMIERPPLGADGAAP
jgi:haloalkane dehalogenase